MFSPLVPTVSYDVFEKPNSEYGTSYDIYSGPALVGFAGDWKTMIRFFKDRLTGGFREDIPVNLWLGDSNKRSIAHLTLETVAALK